MGKPLLFVALDDLWAKYQETREISKQLSSKVWYSNFGFKINLDYLLFPIVDLKTLVGRIKNFDNRPVFTDLKMWNGTRTMISVIERLVDIGVDFLNVYALADNFLPRAIEITEGSKTKVLGLTVLSHYNDAYCQKHFRRSLKETVRHFSEVAIEAGCHGIILPGTTLEAVADFDIIKAVPGIRPDWYKDTRHEEEIKPRVAVENGANILVCGSPIMKSKNPVEALQKILSEIQ